MNLTDAFLVIDMQAGVLFDSYFATDIYRKDQLLGQAQPMQMRR